MSELYFARRQTAIGDYPILGQGGALKNMRDCTTDSTDAQPLYCVMHDSGEQPFISICIPTYRRTAFIRQALESCLKQNYQNFEILVHDDTEDDSLKSIVQSYASEKVRYFQNIPPLGIVPKLNDFFEKSSAEWIVILCDDDYFEPDFLITLSRHIKNSPHATLIRSRYRLVDHQRKELRLDAASPFRLTSLEFLEKLFLPENKNFKMNITGILFQKTLLKSLGGFKNLYKGWHVDRLAWTELGARGESICDPTPLCNVRLHADSITAFMDPNYQNSINADLEMKKRVEEIFREIEKKSLGEDHRESLNQARQSFQKYTNRHLSKSLDRGLIAVLEKKGKNAVDETNEIFNTMRRLQVPLFRSAFIYRLLASFPYPVRSRAMALLQQYKIKKLTR